MSQQGLYVPKIRPQFQKVGGEEMPQGMQNAFLSIPKDFSARAKILRKLVADYSPPPAPSNRYSLGRYYLK